MELETFCSDLSVLILMVNTMWTGIFIFLSQFDFHFNFSVNVFISVET